MMMMSNNNVTYSKLTMLKHPMVYLLALLAVGVVELPEPVASQTTTTITTQTGSGISRTEGCDSGFFKSSFDPNAPCIPCLKCVWNAVAIVDCVTFPVDVNQCQCKPGYFSTGGGGCLPLTVGSPTTPSPPVSVPPPPPPVPVSTTISLPLTSPPPMTNPPPPVTFAPVTVVPVSTAVSPPINSPPITSPLITNPPVSNPPITNPPVSIPPPITSPPITNPPVITNPIPNITNNTSVITTPNNNNTSMGTSVQTGSGISRTEGCDAGFFKSSPDPNAPCIPCLKCVWNADAIVDCVTFPVDVKQCQCKPGYQSTGGGGCLPTDRINRTSSMTESIETTTASSATYNYVFVATAVPLVFHLVVVVVMRM